MKTKEEIKHEIAIKYGHENFNNLVTYTTKQGICNAHDEVMEEYAKQFKTEPKTLKQRNSIRSIICYFFGHIFILKRTDGVLRIGHCNRCAKKMYGAEMKGRLTGVLSWIYIVGDIEN